LISQSRGLGDVYKRQILQLQMLKKRLKSQKKLDTPF
jgi:hypothetical protein